MSQETRPTVLLASADPASLELFAVELVAQGFCCESVRSPHALRSHLQSGLQRPVLVLPDAGSWLDAQEWPQGWPVQFLPTTAVGPALSDNMVWLRTVSAPAGEPNLTSPADVLGRLALTFSIARHLGLTRSPVVAESASERIYQTIFDAMSEGVVVFDAQGIVRAFNAAAARISGYTAEQMLGIALNAPKYRCIDSEGREIAHSDYPAMVCLRTREPIVDQLVGIQRPDLSIAWVSACCQPLLVDGGAGFAGVLSTIRDVSERRNAEQARQASEATLRSFFASAPLSMGVLEDLGDDLLIVRINTFGAQAFGMSPDEMQGRTSRSMGVSEDHVRLWRQNLLASTERELPVSFQYSYELQGQTHWLSATVCPLAADNSQDRYCFVVDLITPRVRAEQTVRQQQLQIAHVQRVSALGQMASELAHELNQPLFAIGNFAAASLQALEGPPEESLVNLRHWLGQIAAQADRAGQIVHRLHRFVRKAPMARQRLELGELVREALELIAVDARLHGVEIDNIAPQQPIQVFVDRIQVQQVLVNLVLNGIEAMSVTEAPHRKLTIRVQLADAAGQAAIVVRDRGRGLGDLTVEQMFEPFFSTKPNGSGMGLPISREIARGLGGELVAAPAAGAGAQFTLTLPLYEAEDE